MSELIITLFIAYITMLCGYWLGYCNAYEDINK